MRFYKYVAPGGADLFPARCIASRSRSQREFFWTKNLADRKVKNRKRKTHDVFPRESGSDFWRKDTMPTFSSAQELIAPGETALCLFTNGNFLTLGPNGIGSSGFWFLDPQRFYQRIIIFRWSLREGQRYVELFTALPEGLDGPETEGAFRGRYSLRLRNIERAGTTDVMWEDFVKADDKVTYVTRENVG